jgi:hypothetical protein
MKSASLQPQLQYRIDKHTCIFRRYGPRNETVFNSEWPYKAEPLFHEMLLQSAHRTLDPSEADYFYVPVYAACYAWPVHGFADAPFYYTAGAGGGGVAAGFFGGAVIG